MNPLKILLAFLAIICILRILAVVLCSLSHRLMDLISHHMGLEPHMEIVFAYTCLALLAVAWMHVGSL